MFGSTMADQNEFSLDLGEAKGSAGGAVDGTGTSANRPLAARMRPRGLKEVVGQEHILKPDSLLPRLIRSDRFGSLVFYGPPGCGKTSLAEAIAAETGSRFVRINAVMSNVAEMRGILAMARQRPEFRTILFIDEIHRFNKAQQDLLLPDVEEGNIRLIGATTFDFNLLRVLDALLQEQSTVKAGERVGLSQPAVSAALGRLRHALGDPLFVRQGQRIIPTDYASGLELPLRRILDDLAALLSGPDSFNPAASTLHFKISGSDFYSELLMPALAETLSRLAPGMQVQQVDLVPDNYVGTLEDHEIDIALVPKAEYPPWVESTPVHRSDFVMIARDGHPRLKRAGVDPESVVPIDLFCDLGHVVFSPQGNLRAMGDAALARVGRERRVVMTMPVMGGVCSAVSSSDLVALVPEQLARKLVPRLGLSVYIPPMPVGPAQICMLWHKRSTSNPSHRWLRGIVSGILSRLDGGNGHTTVV